MKKSQGQRKKYGYLGDFPLILRTKGGEKTLCFGEKARCRGEKILFSCQGHGVLYDTVASIGIALAVKSFAKH